MEEVSEFRGRYVYLCEDSTEGIFTAVCRFRGGLLCEILPEKKIGLFIVLEPDPSFWSRCGREILIGYSQRG